MTTAEKTALDEAFLDLVAAFAEDVQRTNQEVIRFLEEIKQAIEEARVARPPRRRGLFR